jgi:hypothetical protein
LITDAATRQAQSVTELSAATGLRAPNVTACLNRLAAKGLARRLGGTPGLWGAQHDFVARQFAILLGRLRPSPWPRVAIFASPVLFALALATAVFGILIYLENQRAPCEAHVNLIAGRAAAERLRGNSDAALRLVVHGARLGLGSDPHETTGLLANAEQPLPSHNQAGVSF